jgi:predicted nucleic acid-binding protein
VVIVDTTVWVDYFQGFRNPETNWLDAELDRQRLGLTAIILCEVLQGVRDEPAAKHVERQLLKFEVFETAGVDLARRSRAETIASCEAAVTRYARRSIV